MTGVGRQAIYVGSDMYTASSTFIEGRVWAIDNGLCFSSPYKLRTVIWEFGGEDIDDALLDRIAPMVERIPVDIAALLADDEIEAMQRRAIALVTERRLPDDDSGHHYPWPLI